MPDTISITEYAERNSRTRTAVLYHIQAGRIKSAVKQPNGRWLLNADEPYPEDRNSSAHIKSGKYIGCHRSKERHNEVSRAYYAEHPEKFIRTSSAELFASYGDTVLPLGSARLLRRFGTFVIAPSTFRKLTDRVLRKHPDAVITASDGSIVRFDPALKFAVLTKEVSE